jgi:uncharacterized protein YlxP (DUF503 family)
MNIDSESAMKVALAKMEFFFPCVHSLKEKRHILHKIRDRIFSEFKVSVNEVSHQDKWQRAQLGLAVVGNDPIKLNTLVDKVIARIEEYGLGEMVDSIVEVINF